MTYTATIAPPAGAKESNMNITTTLLAPWRSTPRQSAWALLAIFGICSVVGLAASIAIHDAEGNVFAVMFYCLGAFAVWGFGMPWLALLARDARRLCIPGIAGNTALSAVIYGVLTVAIPTLLEGALGRNMPVTALLCALAVTGGLAIMLLPRWAGSMMGLLPAAYVTLHYALHIPSPLDPRFLHWGTPLLVLLLATDIVCWRRLLRSETPTTFGWGTATIFQLPSSTFPGGGLANMQWAWGQSAKRPAQVDLRKVGPHAPTATIQVALGGWYVPQTVVARLRTAGWLAIAILGVGAIMLLVNLGQMHEPVWHKVLVILGVSIGLWVGLFGAMMLTFVTMAVLQRRWQREAELALLALLPGLGRDAPVCRSLVRASLVKPAIVFALLWGFMAATTLPMHLGFTSIVLLGLIEAGAACVTAAMALRTFAGRPPGTAGKLVLMAVILLLMNATGVLAFIAPTPHLERIGVLAEWGLAAAWIVLGAWMARMALHAWRDLQRRPHPFLANAP